MNNYNDFKTNNLFNYANLNLLINEMNMDSNCAKLNFFWLMKYEDFR